MGEVWTRHARAPGGRSVEDVWKPSLYLATYCAPFQHTTPLSHARASAHIHTSHFFPPQAAVRPHAARPLTPHRLRPFIPAALGDDLPDACHGGETGGGNCAGERQGGRFLCRRWGTISLMPAMEVRPGGGNCAGGERQGKSSSSSTCDSSQCQPQTLSPES